MVPIMLREQECRAYADFKESICNANKMPRTEVQDTKCNLVLPESAMFVHIFLILVCCRIATRIDIFYRACDEEMLQSSLILPPLTIISRYECYYKFDKELILYKHHKQAVALYV